MSGRPNSSADPLALVLASLDRIAVAMEAQVKALAGVAEGLAQVAQTNLLLLDELTSGPAEPEEAGEPTHYMNGKPIRDQ